MHIAHTSHSDLTDFEQPEKVEIIYMNIEEKICNHLRSSLFHFIFSHYWLFLYWLNDIVQ